MKIVPSPRNQTEVYEIVSLMGAFKLNIDDMQQNQCRCVS